MPACLLNTLKPPSCTSRAWEGLMSLLLQQTWKGGHAQGGVAPGMPWGPVPCPMGLDRLLCRIHSTRPVCVTHSETTPLHCLMERTLEESWIPNLHPLSLPCVQRITDHLEGTFTTTLREAPPPLAPGESGRQRQCMEWPLGFLWGRAGKPGW